jgi:hypothetical protein
MWSAGGESGRMHRFGLLCAALAAVIALGGCGVCIGGCKQPDLARVVTRMATTPQGGVVVTRCRMDARTTRVSFSHCEEVEIPPEKAGAP